MLRPPLDRSCRAGLSWCPFYVKNFRRLLQLDVGGGTVLPNSVAGIPIEGDSKHQSGGGIQSDGPVSFITRLPVMFPMFYYQCNAILLREVRSNRVYHMTGLAGIAIRLFVTFDNVAPRNPLKHQKTAYLICFAMMNIQFKAHRTIFSGISHHRQSL